MGERKETSAERRNRQVAADRAKWCANPPHLSDERRAKLLARLHELDRTRGRIMQRAATALTPAEHTRLAKLAEPIDRELAEVRERLGLRSQLEVA